MTLQFRLACMFLAVMLVSRSSSAQYQDVLSYAVGYEGLSLIAQNPKFHPQFSITEDQVVRLKVILDDKAIWEKYKSTSMIRGGAAGAVGIDPNARTRILDEFVRTRVPQILDKSQLDAIRIYFFKKQFPKPSNALHSFSLRKFDLDASEIAAVCKVTEPLIVDMAKVRNRQVGEALKEVMPLFTDSQRQRIANLAGSKVAPGYVPKSKSVSELQILHESQPVMQMYQSTQVLFSNGQRLTDERCEQIHRLAGKFEVKSVGKGYLDLDVDQELSKILSEEERLDLLRVTHWKSIALDVTWLAKPEVLTYLKVDEDFDRAKLLDSLERSQAKILGTETLMEKRIFFDGLRAVPAPKRKQMEEWLSNVWTFD